jgi:TRAF3-interacting protein 1
VEINSDIAATRAALDPIISKPKLADKLLGKPPFRFLHDIIMNVRVATGFMEGLFEAEEMEGSKISGKGPKMAFLDKAINATCLFLGTALSVRPVWSLCPSFNGALRLMHAFLNLACSLGPLC